MSAYLNILEGSPLWEQLLAPAKSLKFWPFMQFVLFVGLLMCLVVTNNNFEKNLTNKGKKRRRTNIKIQKPLNISNMSGQIKIYKIHFKISKS